MRLLEANGVAKEHIEWALSDPSKLRQAAKLINLNEFPSKVDTVKRLWNILPPEVKSNGARRFAALISKGDATNTRVHEIFNTKIRFDAAPSVSEQLHTQINQDVKAWFYLKTTAPTKASIQRLSVVIQRWSVQDQEKAAAILLGSETTDDAERAFTCLARTKQASAKTLLWVAATLEHASPPAVAEYADFIDSTDVDNTLARRFVVDRIDLKHKSVVKEFCERNPADAQARFESLKANKFDIELAESALSKYFSSKRALELLGITATARAHIAKTDIDAQNAAAFRESNSINGSSCTMSGLDGMLPSLILALNQIRGAISVLEPGQETPAITVGLPDCQEQIWYRQERTLDSLDPERLFKKRWVSLELVVGKQPNGILYLKHCRPNGA